MSKTFNYRQKVVILGDSGVGKTTLIKKYIDDVFKDESVATIGMDFHTKTKHIYDKDIINNDIEAVICCMKLILFVKKRCLLVNTNNFVVLISIAKAQPYQRLIIL